ncbi:hypothetical protein HDV05_007663, partial [Chytridiales sp. JEL 0842]
MTLPSTLSLLTLIILAPQPAHPFDWTVLTAGSHVTAFSSIMTVPPLPRTPGPAATATYFLWPGLQPFRGSTNFMPIGNGVLQPVLAFGPACTPNQPLNLSPYRGWWISAQYVQTKGTLTTHRGCLGGDVMDVTPGDILKMDMYILPGATNTSSIWRQTVVRVGKPCLPTANGRNTPDGCLVSFDLDMLGQSQNRAQLVIELYGSTVVDFDLQFSDIAIQLNKAEANDPRVRFCDTQGRYLQPFETCTGISLSPDGRTCTVSSCLFTAPAPNTPMPPILVDSPRGNGTSTGGDVSPGAGGGIDDPTLDPVNPDGTIPDPANPATPTPNTGDGSTPSGSAGGTTNGGGGDGNRANSGNAGPGANNATNAAQKGTGLSIGVIAGIGAAAFVAVLAVIGFVVYRRRRQASKEKREGEHGLPYDQSRGGHPSKSGHEEMHGAVFGS